MHCSHTTVFFSASCLPWVGFADIDPRRLLLPDARSLARDLELELLYLTGLTLFISLLDWLAQFRIRVEEFVCHRGQTNRNVVPTIYYDARSLARDLELELLYLTGLTLFISLLDWLAQFRIRVEEFVCHRGQTNRNVVRSIIPS